jgi:hypothetical protein
MSEETIQEDKKRRKRIGKGRTEKREGEEEKVFRTSKKTAKSPELEKKAGTEMENILEKLEGMEVEIKNQTKELRKERTNTEIERLKGKNLRIKKRNARKRKTACLRVGRLERKMKNEERRRGKNNIVITGCRGEGKSKQQIKEDIEKFIKEDIEEAKVKDCYNINKDQLLTEMEEWSGKEKMMKQKGKLREKEETEKIFLYTGCLKIPEFRNQSVVGDHFGSPNMEIKKKNRDSPHKDTLV